MTRLLKYLVIAILLSFSISVQAQTPIGTKTRFPGIWYQYRDTSSATSADTACVFYFNNKFFGRGGPSTHWKEFAMLTGSGFVQISDTSAMLSKYLRKTDTAFMVLPYLRKTDTSYMLSNRLKISDTLTMLSNLLRKTDTLNMLANLFRKSDTANAYSGYQRSGNPVTVAAQPNITSLGSLTGLTVSGNISANNITVTGRVTAGTFSGSGANLINIPNAALSNNSITINTTGTISGGGSVVLGGALTIVGVSSGGGGITLTGNPNGIVPSAPNGNVNLTLSTGLILPGTLSTTGNISAGGITVTGNIQTLNISATGVTRSATLIANQLTIDPTYPFNQDGNIILGLAPSGQVSTMGSNTGTNRVTYDQSASRLNVTNLAVSGTITTAGLSVSGIITAAGLTATGGIDIATANISGALTVVGTINETSTGTSSGIKFGNYRIYQTSGGFLAINDNNGITLLTIDPNGNLQTGGTTGNILGGKLLMSPTGGANTVGISTTGTINGNNLSVTNGILANSLSVTGTITANNFVGTLTTAVQPNITSLGTQTAITTTPSGGVNFGQTNNLNYYGRGLSQVTLTCGTSGTITLNTGQDSLSWVRIGDEVFVHGAIVITSVSSPVGSLTLNGLPFTNGSGLSRRASVTIRGSSLNTVATDNLIGIVVDGASTILIQKLSTAGGLNDLSQDCQTGTNFTFDFHYRLN